ncbi:hypothetical protein NW766_001795 [Fusarium irregulare]|uniref:Methyltransferase type 11 domain-containing protein n=1 Tax=Fusarium irregulare TaxID=2494466 RepID=A0A9W8PZA9_9HYPO|nr:hypothetical protein NW766_001795 [Fusarium irregulare]
MECDTPAPVYQYSSIARTGFVVPSQYDKYRPSYPDQVVEYLIGSLEIPHGACILELGAGTGKLTELLSSHELDFRIIAVEPHDDMRAFLRDKHLRNVSVIDGLAENIPLSDEAVNCVLVAQAFHWFANETSLREIHRVLRPDGGLGMVWNIEDYNSPWSLRPQTDWESQLRELIWSLDDGQPRFKSEAWQGIECLRLHQVIDVADLESRIFTYCMLQNASDDQRKKHRKRVRRILQEAGNAGDDQIEMRTSVIAAWTRKT